MKVRIIFTGLVVSLSALFADEDFISLDQYLTNLGVTKEQNAGHTNTTPRYDQKAEYFHSLLQANPNVRSVVEIGFCLGHSSDVILNVRPDIQMVSFDMMYHWFNDAGKKYIDMKYPSRHALFRGDSLATVPCFTRDYKNTTFDLIFIDGGHEYHVALGDIINMQHLARPDTILIVDDTNFEPVNRAWKKCVDDGLVEELERVSDYSLGWVRGRYLKR